jgi:RNA polymerase sigma factor (sigma-70 family)
VEPDDDMNPSRIHPERSAGAEAAGPDAHLARAALAGDREAYGQLVARHQSKVCAVACAVTGDHDRGRDVAQETFLEAWRSLAGLRDTTNVGPWLCGIARNLSNGANRRDARRAAASLDSVPEPASPLAPPHEAAGAREEQETVWRALRDLPPSYREVLLLFYWEDQSISRIADTLGLGDDAVRQRLSRARRLLRAGLEGLVERGLRTARPGGAFTATVMAALSPGAAEAAAATGLTTATGLTSASARIAVGAGLGGALAGTAVGVMGGLIGAWASIRSTRSPRERRFMVRVAILFFALASGVAALLAMALASLATDVAAPASRSPWVLAGIAALVAAEAALVIRAVVWVNRRQRAIQIEDGTYVAVGPRSPRERRFLVFAGGASLAYVLAFLAALAVFEHLRPGLAGSAWGQLTAWSLYLVGLMWVVGWINRRHNRILVGEGRVAPEPPRAPGAPTREVGASPVTIWSSLAGGVIGGTLWMYPMCWFAGDWLAALAILALSTTILVVSARAAIRRPERYFRIAFHETIATGSLVLAAVSSCYERWMVEYRASRWYDPSGDWPLWVVELAIVGLFGWLAWDMRRRDRRHRLGG